MAEVDLLVPQRDNIADRNENWEVVEEEFDEDDEQPRETPSGNDASDDSPPPPEKQPRVDVNIDDHNLEEGPTSGERGPPQRRKKHRRGKTKKRKWKPYYKLTWTEKQELEDREAKRAHRVREERWAHGQPVAPYNTTQFLMEDHNVQEPDLELIANGHHHRHHRESTSIESSDEFYSSPEDEEEFLQKEFSAVYESIHAERLNSMTKSELVQEYIQLEDRVDKLEQKLKIVEETRDLCPRSPPPPPSISTNSTTTTKDCEVQVTQEEEWDADSENLEKIRIFQEEIRLLVEVNERLRLENEALKQTNESSVSMDTTDDSQKVTDGFNEGTLIEKKSDETV